MNEKGLTLLEILISLMILALVMTGLANIFVAGKRQIQRSRSRIQAAELGKLFLEPLAMQVRQDEWDTSSNCLSGNVGCPTPEPIDNTLYTPTYSITPLGNLRKVKVTISWPE